MPLDPWLIEMTVYCLVSVFSIIFLQIHLDGVLSNLQFSAARLVLTDTYSPMSCLAYASEREDHKIPLCPIMGRPLLLGKASPCLITRLGSG